jgi:hypothetical protein
MAYMLIAIGAGLAGTPASHSLTVRPRAARAGMASGTAAVHRIPPRRVPVTAGAYPDVRIWIGPLAGLRGAIEPVTHVKGRSYGHLVWE